MLSNNIRTTQLQRVMNNQLVSVTSFYQIIIPVMWRGSRTWSRSNTAKCARNRKVEAQLSGMGHARWL